MTRLCTCTPRVDDEGYVSHAPTCKLYGVNTLTDPDPTTNDEPAAAKLAGPPVPEHVGYDLVEPKPEAVEHCALLIHETIRAMNDSMNEHTLPWETNKANVVAGISRMLENPFETPEQNHQAWWDYKVKEGWAYGPSKDATLKTHPCMVPYSALGPFAKSKDAVFQAIVRTYFGLPS